MSGDAMMGALLVAPAAMVAAAAGAAIGGIVAPSSKKARKYARVGAAVGALGGGALAGATAAMPFMCGLFADEARKAEIDRVVAPRRIPIALGSGVLAAAGTVAGSMISKSYPIYGAIGGAVLGGIVPALFTPECPGRTGTLSDPRFP